MTLIYCAAGIGLFGVMTRFWSPAVSLAALLILAILMRIALE
jgi:hypothetical protein